MEYREEPELLEAMASRVRQGLRVLSGCKGLLAPKGLAGLKEFKEYKGQP
jgi:hypothetical protein